MKPLSKRTIEATICLAAAAAMFAGCSPMEPIHPSAVGRNTNGRLGNDWAAGTNSTGGSTTSSGTTTGSTNSRSGSGHYSAGATATLAADRTALRDFFAPRTGIANPINIEINIDMSTVFDPVIIGFDEANGGGFERALGTHHPDSSTQDASFNHWYAINGQNVYKGFFQDRYGAVVILLTAGNNGVGDGGGRTLKGSVYYQNFDTSYAKNPFQGPLRMCWQITEGNHDCRTWMINDIVHAEQGLEPTFGDKGPDMSVGYQRLGTFSGMARAATGL